MQLSFPYMNTMRNFGPEMGAVWHTFAGGEYALAQRSKARACESLTRDLVATVEQICTAEGGHCSLGFRGLGV